MIDRRLLDKAERALKAARDALANGDTETSADRAYYSVYYAAWALLDARGLPRPKTHQGLIAEFSRHFVKEGPLAPEIGAILSRLESLRLAADYTLQPIPVADAERAIAEASSFLREIASVETDGNSSGR